MFFLNPGRSGVRGATRVVEKGSEVLVSQTLKKRRPLRSLHLLYPAVAVVKSREASSMDSGFGQTGFGNAR